MLSTPLGPIKVFADGTKLDCEVMEFTYDRPPVKGHPIAGCYRIHAPVGEHRSIRCEVGLNDTSIVNTDASGERYVDAEFISDSIILTIGAEDENPAFETVRVEFGLEYRILSSVSEVVFGIAWATDYEGPSDCRTWYAADPTLDKRDVT